MHVPVWDRDATDLVGKFTHFVGRVLDVLDLAAWPAIWEGSWAKNSTFGHQDILKYVE